jgi:hypothetical protein
MEKSPWVQDWVQVAAPKRAPGFVRRVNESVDGYEPGGRTFESCWAHQNPSENQSRCRGLSPVVTSHVT